MVSHSRTVNFTFPPLLSQPRDRTDFHYSWYLTMGAILHGGRIAHKLRGRCLSAKDPGDSDPNLGTSAHTNGRVCMSTGEMLFERKLLSYEGS